MTNGPAQTTVTKNELLGNAGDGLFVDTAVLATSVAQNTAVGNLVSGLNVDTAAATLAQGLAVGNLGVGINTPFGATDGGGNKAHDNDGLHQCTPPIVCP